MLMTMNNTKQISILLIIILFAVQSTACGVASTVPTVTATTLPSLTLITPSISPTITPSLIPTITPTLTPTITFTSMPDFCNSALWQEKIQIVSQSVFTALGPGPTVYDRILVEQNPAWLIFVSTTAVRSEVQGLSSMKSLLDLQALNSAKELALQYFW